MEKLTVISVLITLTTALIKLTTATFKIKKPSPMPLTNLALIATVAVCAIALIAICYLGKKG